MFLPQSLQDRVQLIQLLFAVGVGQKVYSLVQLDANRLTKIFLLFGQPWIHAGQNVGLRVAQQLGKRSAPREFAGLKRKHIKTLCWLSLVFADEAIDICRVTFVGTGGKSRCENTIIEIAPDV